VLLDALEHSFEQPLPCDPQKKLHTFAHHPKLRRGGPGKSKTEIKKDKRYNT
jgi:hypothetical protein